MKHWGKYETQDRRLLPRPRRKVMENHKERAKTYEKSKTSEEKTMTRLEQLKSACDINGIRPNGAVVIEPDELFALLAVTEVLHKALTLLATKSPFTKDALAIYNRWNEAEDA